MRLSVRPLLLLLSLGGLTLLGCGGGNSAPAESMPPATVASLDAAVHDYHACGLDVLTPAAQGDCVARLLERLGERRYSGDAVTLDGQVRLAGTEYRRCLAAAPPTDVTTCGGGALYQALTQLRRVLRDQPAS